MGNHFCSVTMLEKLLRRLSRLKNILEQLSWMVILSTQRPIFLCKIPAHLWHWWSLVMQRIYRRQSLVSTSRSMGREKSGKGYFLKNPYNANRLVHILTRWKTTPFCVPYIIKHRCHSHRKVWRIHSQTSATLVPNLITITIWRRFMTSSRKMIPSQLHWFLILWGKSYPKNGIYPHLEYPGYYSEKNGVYDN